MQLHCLHFDTLDSTNTWSKTNYSSFSPLDLTLVTADQQTAGRGRYQRYWHSPSGQNIYATFTFFVPKERKDIFNIPQVMVLSAIQTLKELGISPSIKWPNDILVSGKKISGILCETVSEGNHLVIVCGIGLNVNMPEELLKEISQPATSLYVETGKTFSVPSVLEILQKHFLQDLQIFLQKGFSPFLEAFKQNLIHKKGTLLKIQQQEVFFEAIDQDGALFVRLSDGKIQKVYSGEIVY